LSLDPTLRASKQIFVFVVVLALRKSLFSWPPYNFLASRIQTAEETVIWISLPCCSACLGSKSQSAAAATSLIVQTSVSLVKQMIKEAQALQGAHELQAYLQVVMGFTEGHKEVIDMWGRYPHRNKILGRSNTPEEDKAMAAGSVPQFWLNSNYALFWHA